MRKMEAIIGTILLQCVTVSSAIFGHVHFWKLQRTDERNIATRFAAVDISQKVALHSLSAKIDTISVNNGNDRNIKIW